MVQVLANLIFTGQNRETFDCNLLEGMTLCLFAPLPPDLISQIMKNEEMRKFLLSGQAAKAAMLSKP